jgi:hypothetical protein
MVTPIISTSYTVTVTSANGCIAMDDVYVTVNAVPNANAGNPVFICPNGSASLTGTGAGSYLWTPGNFTSANIQVSPVATTVYTLVVSSTAGCSDTDSVKVTVRPKPTAIVSHDTAVCSNSPIVLTASGGNSYLWSPGASTNSSITTTLTSTTVYTVQVSNSFGCHDSKNVVVRINPLPVVNAGNDTAICLHGGVTLTASGSGSYSWSPIASTDSTVYVSPLNSAYYRVTVTDSNNCSKSDSVHVIVNPLPVANAGNDRAICMTGQTTLIATGGGNYFWTPGSFTDDSVFVAPTVTTQYALRVTDGNGCQYE